VAFGHPLPPTAQYLFVILGQDAFLSLLS
jgi:hypothetical protein